MRIPVPHPVLFLAGFIALATTIRSEESRLLLPPEIHLVPGIETKLRFANAILDEEGPAPVFKAECPIGELAEDSWRFLAKPGDIGRHTFRLEVRRGGQVEQAESTVHVIPADAGSGREISLLIVGDSLTNASQYPNEIGRLLSEPGNPTWRMLGTHRPSSAKPGIVHEGYGGWTWKRFRTKWDPEHPEPGKTASSPFVFDGKLDMARFFEDRCGGTRPDFLLVLLGINDCFHADPDDPAAVEKKIDDMFAEAGLLLAAIRAASPDTDIGIGLTTPGNVRDAAFVANYGDRYTRRGWRVIRHRVVERQIEHFRGREDERLFLVPTGFFLDCENGFPENNGVHPNTVGYNQIATTFYAWVKGRLAANRAK